MVSTSRRHILLDSGQDDKAHRLHPILAHNDSCLTDLRSVLCQSDLGASPDTLKLVKPHVETQTGTFIGLLNETYPDVRQFRRVPFAKGAIAWSISEDCLSLAVWTPSSASSSSKLPVALFVTAGHGITGGVDIPSQVPAQWVPRSQEHLVVTVNYRVNIFGNPRSRALEEISLSLLDVRAAVEWIEEYINRFHDTPSVAFTNYIPDEKYIFSNETQRYLEGKVARGPAIRSSAARESASPNITSTAEAQREWLCSSVSDTRLRYELNLDTYRYLWAARPTGLVPFTGLTCSWSLGLTAKDVGEVPQLEMNTSVAMQDFFLAFLKDPATVTQKVGWPLSNPEALNGGWIVEFGNGVPVRNITGRYLDRGCYNSSLPMRISG
ncbi:Alpha/Beta hydrolase protein [Aspergillus aurantiobrunneus]